MPDRSVTKVEAAHAPRGPEGQRYLASGCSVSMRLWENEPPGIRTPSVRRFPRSSNPCPSALPIWVLHIPSTMPPEAVRDFGRNALLKRPGQPAEAAPAYVLPASDDGRCITGAVVPVTGGRPML